MVHYGAAHDHRTDIRADSVLIATAASARACFSHANASKRHVPGARLRRVASDEGHHLPMSWMPILKGASITGIVAEQAVGHQRKPIKHRVADVWLPCAGVLEHALVRPRVCFVREV